MSEAPHTGAPRQRSLRVAPLPEAERSSNPLLSTVGSLAATNFFATLVKHPAVFRRWAPLGGALAAGLLPERDRELLILRTAHRCGCSYAWEHHGVLARHAGLSADEIAAVQVGPSWPRWTAFDAALLRAVDELHDDASVTDETWALLRGHYGEAQLMEVPMLVGHYHAVSFVINALGIQIEPDFRVPGSLRDHLRD